MVFFIFIQNLKETSVCKQWNTWSDAAFVVSDLALHCLSMSHKKDSRLIWVNIVIPNHVIIGVKKDTD